MAGTWAAPLALLTVLSTVLMTVGLYLESRGRWLVYVFKPLATLAVLAFAVLALAAHPSSYGWAVVIGLIASLAGDVFLMLPSDRFREGLASFLLAHIAYLVAFTSGVAWADPAWPFLVWGLLALPVIARLWPGLPAGLRAPVLVYMAVLLVMASQAASRALATGETAAWMAAAGAALFVFSDTCLAFDRFARRFAAAPALVHLSYFAAQWLIASSVPAR